jgi:Leucine-rich repeat (LRR) protein
LIYIPTLPINIGVVDCSNNKIIKLPSQSTTELTHFDCSYNLITELPPLSIHLIELYCNDNKLKQLPVLPNQIIRIDCSNNHITHLPKLPEFLKKLICSDNNLRYLPLLPETIDTIYIDNNPMVEYFSCFDITLLRKQVCIVYNFRSTYYHLKFKTKFRNLLWKMREPRIQKYYSPENLIRLLETIDNNECDDNETLYKVLTNW